MNAFDDIEPPDFGDAPLAEDSSPASPRIRRQTLVGFALAAALVTGAVATAALVVYPEWNEAKGVSAHARELEAIAVRQKPLTQRRVSDLVQGLASYDSMLVAMSRMIPDSSEVSEQLRALARVSREYSVTIARIAPQTPVTDSVFTRREFNVDLVGSYHAVGQVLAEVSNLDRLLIPRGLVLVPNERMTSLAKPIHGDRPMLLTATLRLVTFTVPTPTERAIYLTNLAKVPKKVSPGIKAVAGSSDKIEPPKK